MDDEKELEELVEEEDLTTEVDDFNDVKVEEETKEPEMDENVDNVNVEEDAVDSELSDVESIDEVSVAEEPRVEEPVVEEPTVEEPTVEEPAVEEANLPPEENVGEPAMEATMENEGTGDVAEPNNKKKLITFGVIILLVIGALVFFFLVNSEEEIPEEEDDTTLLTAFNNTNEADSFVILARSNLYNNDRAILLEEFVVWYDFVNDYIYYASEESEKYFVGIEAGRAFKYYLDEDEDWVEESIPGIDLPSMQTVLLDGMVLPHLEEYLDEFTEVEEDEYVLRIDDYDLRVFEEEFTSEENEEDMLELVINLDGEYISSILVIYYKNDVKENGFELSFSDINEAVIEIPEVVEKEEEEEEEEDFSQAQAIFRSNALLLLTTARNVYNEAVLAGDDVETVEYSFPYENDEPRLDVETFEPAGGSLVVLDDGVIYMAFHDDVFCAYKSYNSETVMIVFLEELPAGSTCTVTGLADTGEGNPVFEKSEE